MGVPKFFRYMSERYPLISQLIQENKIPEFDNLYLDMNGIIHNCSHDDGPSHIPEHQIFLSIFAYVDHLFTKIKPKKVFFMAIDGVAPRAKMNQQRSRRFRTAREAERQQKDAERKGTAKKGDPFDSNCITPGTPFMARLSASLKYFVNKKVTEDSAWRDVTVILSGHEVPGEGEHKIMEYIRLCKAQTDYNPNVRHCLYGLDADLIMLGLLSHDPHFCLLREEVLFGRDRNRKPKGLEAQNFFLLHLSLFREYLDLEFSSLSTNADLPFEYDLERVIDDFVLLAIFVGNDFLPHLPGLHINEGAFNRIFDSYKKILPKAGGYLNEHGTLNVQRLQLFLDEMAIYERENFEKEFADSNWFKGKQSKHIEAMEKARARNKLVLTSEQKNLFTKIKNYVQSNISKDPSETITFPNNFPARDRRFLQELADELKLTIAFDTYDDYGQNVVTLGFDSDMVSLAREEADITKLEKEDAANGEWEDVKDDSSEQWEWKEAIERVFKKYDKAEVAKDMSEGDYEESYEKKLKEQMDSWKGDYYLGKLEFDFDDKKSLNKLCYSFVEGLQWVLHYYYDGISSWPWFYPYHYAPKISDLSNAKDYKFDFKLGEPFKPFEQLMGVLPSLSKSLVPEPYRELMTNSESPIIDFYPIDFETDMNGKKQDWEAVVKIPFIEEARLLKAMKAKEPLLTDEERARNSFGNSWLFRYDPTSTFYPSSLPGFFPDMPACHCKMETYHLPTLNGLRLVKGLCEGVLLGKDAIAGFPSLNTIPHSGVLGFHGVNVFQSESRNETVVITLENVFDSLKVEEVALTLLGKRVYVGWPYLEEARVSKVSDELFSYHLDHSGKVEGKPHEADALISFRKISERLEHVYSKRYGTVIGNVDVILHVQLLKGMQRLEDGSLVKLYEEKETEYALQTTCESVSSEDPRYMEQAAAPIEQDFPEGCRVFFLGGNAYGVPSQVIGHHNNTLAVRIAFFVHDRQEHFIFQSTLAKSKSKDLYFPSPNVARAIGISSLALAKITSTLMVQTKDGKVNIGLGLKFEAKGQKVLGYTKKGEMGWDFSQSAVELVEEYVKLFPEVLRAINARRDPTTMVHFFPNGDGPTKLQEIRAWLKKKGVLDLERVPIYADQLDKTAIQALEALSDQLQTRKTPDKMKQAVIKGIPRTAVLKPDHTTSRLQGQKFALGDRVIMVADTGNVPLSAKGVVVGIQASLIDVDFDIPFMAGSNLQGRCSEYRGASVLPTAILNLSNPQKLVATPQTSQNPRAPQPHNGNRAENGVVTRGRQVGGPALVPTRGLPAGGFHPARGRGNNHQPTAIITNPSRLQNPVLPSPKSPASANSTASPQHSDNLRSALNGHKGPAPHLRGRGGAWRGSLPSNWNIQSPSDPPPFNRGRGFFRGRGRGQGDANRVSS